MSSGSAAGVLSSALALQFYRVTDPAIGMEPALSTA